MTDFKAKIHPIRFRLGLPPDPAGELKALPRPPSWIWGAASRQGRGWAGVEEGKGEGKGREGEVEGREREGPQVTVEPGGLRALLRHWVVCYNNYNENDEKTPRQKISLLLATMTTTTTTTIIITSCARGDTIRPRPLQVNIIFVFIRQVALFPHVGYLRHQQQVDLWPFDLESGVRDTCANFSVPRPLCSRFRPDVCDRQTERRQSDVRQNHRLMHPPYGGRA